MQFFECVIPPFYTKLQKVHSEVQVIDFQKIPVVLSKWDAVAIELTFEMSYVIAMCGKGILNLKSKHFFAIGQSHKRLLKT